MSELVIVALISGGCSFLASLTASIIGNNKTKALILYRLEQIERKQDKHNSVIERTYKLETDLAVQEESIKVINHRLEDIERA